MNIPDVPLPPWLRRIQQTYLAQVIALPIITGFGASVFLFGCLSNWIDGSSLMLDKACMHKAALVTLGGFFQALFSGHSPGSASFYKDGTKKDA